MESYHGMLACVIAGAGIGLFRALCWKVCRGITRLKRGVS